MVAFLGKTKTIKQLGRWSFGGLLFFQGPSISIGKRSGCEIQPEPRHGGGLRQRVPERIPGVDGGLNKTGVSLLRPEPLLWVT